MLHIKALTRGRSEKLSLCCAASSVSYENCPTTIVVHFVPCHVNLQKIFWLLCDQKEFKKNFATKNVLSMCRASTGEESMQATRSDGLFGKNLIPYSVSVSGSAVAKSLYLQIHDRQDQPLLCMRTRWISYNKTSFQKPERCCKIRCSVCSHVTSGPEHHSTLWNGNAIWCCNLCMTGG